MFKDIIGHKSIKEHLIKQVVEKRIPHAQLFFGDEGVGKLGLALSYAQYIMCEHPSGEDACGVCPSCVKFRQMAHPDLHFVFPIIKPPGKTSVVCDDFVQEYREMLIRSPYFTMQDWYDKIGMGAKQGSIYANESSEIVRKLNLKTYESEYKVMIIWLPELMNITCANKLLKILEEPPEKTVFLLVANNKDAIITTMLSRTQHLFIPRLSEDEIVNAILAQHHEIKYDTVKNAARIAEGSFTHAVKNLEQNQEHHTNYNKFVELMRLAWKVGNKRDYDSLISLRNWSDEMSAADRGREKQKNFLNYAQFMVRENFIFNLKQTNLNYMSDYETDFSLNFSPFINERNVEEMMQEFSLAEKQIEQNTYAKMIFFDLALKMIVLLKK